MARFVFGPFKTSRRGPCGASCFFDPFLASGLLEVIFCLAAALAFYPSASSVESWSLLAESSDSPWNTFWRDVPRSSDSSNSIPVVSCSPESEAAGSMVLSLTSDLDGSFFIWDLCSGVSVYAEQTWSRTGLWYS